MGSPDHSDIVMIEKRLKSAAKRRRELAPEVAMAVTVIDYDSERRKSLLARHAVKHIKAGESSAAAETLARADPVYDQELQTLFSQYQTAQATLKEDDAENTSWETARSLLARKREELKTLPGTEL